MSWIINVVALCFVIYGVVLVRNGKTTMKSYLKLIPTKYTRFDIIIGLCIGIIAMLGIYIMELHFGFIQFSKTTHDYGKLANLFMIMTVMAFGEELLFRGYMLNGLLQLLKNKYTAVLITGILFGLAHAGNPNATPLSIISNGLGGVMYSIAFIESESIWLPFALHFAWNFVQGPIFGFPVSGITFRSIILQNFVAGKGIFTGAGYGPEGGIIGISFRFLVIIMLLLYYYFSIKERNIVAANN